MGLSSTKTKKIIIIGGGFGGVYTILSLKDLINSKKIEVTLISKNNFFLFTPMIHEVATGGLDVSNVTLSIKEILSKYPIEFIHSNADEVDFNKKIVKTDVGSFNYDYLVLATGAKNNFYNVKGANKYALPLKNLSDAILIKEKIVDCFERASREGDKELRKKMLHFVVVGAGPTGVELITEMSELIYYDLAKFYSSHINKNEIKLSLVCGNNGILNNFSNKSQATAIRELKEMNVNIINDCMVSEVRDGELVLSSNKSLISSSVFWAAGVTPNLPKLTPHPKTDHQNRLIVKETLQLDEHDTVFALGDIASGWPMLAYTATRQAKYVACNIKNIIENKNLHRFTFSPSVKLISLGRKNAIGEFWNYSFKGRLIWFLWRTVYLTKIISIKKRIQIAINWTFNLISPRDITKV